MLTKTQILGGGGGPKCFFAIRFPLTRYYQPIKQKKTQIPKGIVISCDYSSLKEINRSTMKKGENNTKMNF